MDEEHMDLRMTEDKIPGFCLKLKQKYSEK